MKKNRLKEIVIQKCILINKGKKSREKKYKPKDEVLKLSKTLGVNWWTVWRWYSGASNPRSENYFKLPEIYGFKLDDFYCRTI